MNKREILQTVLIVILFFLFKNSFFSLFSVIKTSECSIAEVYSLKYQSNEALNRYNKLLETIEFKNELLNENYIISKVLIRNQNEFYHNIIINYGENKGLTKGMAIMSEHGLIGLIDIVNKNHSFVKLLTSGNISISVKIENTYGMITGYKDGYIIVGKINNFEELHEGDSVVTSSYGALSENIEIGNVKKIDYDAKGIEKIVYVKSNVDFNNISYVYVSKELVGGLE